MLNIQFDIEYISNIEHLLSLSDKIAKGIALQTFKPYIMAYNIDIGTTILNMPKSDKLLPGHLFFPHEQPSKMAAQIYINTGSALFLKYNPQNKSYRPYKYALKYTILAFLESLLNIDSYTNLDTHDIYYLNKKIGGFECFSYNGVNIEYALVQCYNPDDPGLEVRLNTIRERDPYPGCRNTVIGTLPIDKSVVIKNVLKLLKGVIS